MNTHKSLKLLARLLMLGLLLSTAACAVLPQVAPVEGEEREQVIAMSEPMADNLLAGMNDGDYAAFSRDFDDAMRKALNEKAFNEMMTNFNDKIGAYQSREIDKVERVENIVVVIYSARYEKEETVAVRLSIREGETPQVAGLWFDSPKLREK